MGFLINRINSLSKLPCPANLIFRDSKIKTKTGRETSDRPIASWSYSSAGIGQASWSRWSRCGRYPWIASRATGISEAAWGSLSSERTRTTARPSSTRRPVASAATRCRSVCTSATRLCERVPSLRSETEFRRVRIGRDLEGQSSRRKMKVGV